MQKKSKENASQDEPQCVLLKEADEPRRKVWIDWIQISISVVSVIATVISVFFATSMINNTLDTTIAAAISNSNAQKQTQVVIEPRDGDIIVRDGDDYKLLQLIEIGDIVFPSRIQEIQYSASKSDSNKRVDINNSNNDDWSQRDSFRYIISSFSINPNKVINLLDNITCINVYCDFYTEKNIASFVDLGEKTFQFEIIGNDKESINITKSNISSEYEYVTKELNDGIEWVKIRVEIVYSINGKTIVDSISTDWIETSPDYVG